MQLSINTTTLGSGLLWNHCTERHCALGLVCKEAGIEDVEMDHRSSIVFKKRPDEKNAKGQVKIFPLKEFPNELSLFFVVDTNWNPISESYKDSVRFKVNTLGQEVNSLNDNRPDGWQDQMVETLTLGGVELTWEDNQVE